MRWLVSALLLVVWLWAMVTAQPFGPWIHILLILALISICVSLLRDSPAEYT